MADYGDYFSGDFNNYSYSNDNTTTVFQSDNCLKDVLCAILVVVNVVIFLLGICGNAMVIWIAGFKIKKTVITTWYLSLAISDFIYCAFLPFKITIIALYSNWIFGRYMCKFTQFVLFVNMFSSIFLLVIISVDRCFTVVFPVLAQNNRTLRRASTAVILAWAVSIALSMPSLVFREIESRSGKTKCFDTYEGHTHTTIVVSQFVCGFVLPMIMIGLCYAIIIIRLRNNRMATSTKPFKVMTALIAIFILSWLPYHLFILLQIDFLHLSYIVTGVRISFTLATANSCLNPFLYAFMGNNFKQKFWSFLPMIENAFDEECQSESSRRSSLTRSYSKMSTCV